MTQDPEDASPEEPRDHRSGQPSDGGGRKLDEDAAWRAIIENYGERAHLDDAPSSSAGPVEAPPADPVTPAPPATSGEPIETAREDTPRSGTTGDGNHFVPPEPPPLPPLEPRRKLAWIGLFGSPVMMLLAVVFGLSPPGWVMGALVAGFVGGFGYLVATMPRSRPDDWPGDDGAVV